MQDFRKRRSARAELARAALLSVGVLAAGALAFFAVRGAWGMYQRFAAAAAAAAAAQARLDGLSARHEEVGAALEELKTPRGVEASLRERYGVARPGEGEITVVRQGAAPTPADAGQGGWWGRLWHAVFVW